MTANCAKPIRLRHAARRYAVRVACVALGWMLCCAATSSAQPPSEPGNGKPSANGAPADADAVPSEFGREIFYVYDGEGANKKLKLLVKDFTFEEFYRRLKKTEKPATAPPEFVIESLTVAGDLQADYADLRLTLVIENLAKSSDKFLRIPLRLDGAIIPPGDSVKYDNSVDFVLEAGGDNEGWIGWLRGGAGAKSTLQLRLLAPVQRIGDRSMLRTNFPRANSSQMQLTADGNNVEAEVLAGGNGEPLQRSGQKTIIPVTSVAGDFQMTWHRPPSKPGPGKNQFVVEGLQIISVEGDQVVTDATLTVKSPVRPFQEFTVKLPPASQLVSEPTGEGYSIEPLPGAGQGNKPQRVKVTLDNPSAGPVAVRLKTRSEITGGEDPEFSKELQFAGFEVERALRQSGYIGVQFGDWRHQWKEKGFSGFDIRPVDPALDVFPSKDMFTFQYFNQGYSLKAEIRPPQRKVSVAPEYLFDVSADSVELTARLNYQVQGWGDELVVDPNGWDLELQNSTPADIVESLADGESGTKKLVLSRTFKGQLVVELRAKAALEVVDGVISLGLPKPEADAPGMTTVVVQPRDNVRLTAKTAPVKAPVFAPFIMPDRQQEPIYFIYDRGDGVPELFEFSLEVNPTVIRAEVDSLVRLSRQSASVSQTLRYYVLHGREQYLEMYVPLSLLDRDDFEIASGGEPIDPATIAAEPMNGTNGDSRPIQVPIKDGVDRVEFTVDFEMPMDGLSADSSLMVAIPLVMPKEKDVERNRLTIEVGAGLHPEVTDAAWTAIVAPNVGDAPVPLVYESDGEARSATLKVDLAAEVADTGLTVEQAWIQTWFTGGARYDYAAFRFQSRRDILEIQLPRGAVAKNTEIHLDGAHLPPNVTAERRLRLELSDLPNADGDHVLVLRYIGDGRPAGWGRLTVDLPSFVGEVQVKNPVFWQLVLNRREHLLNVPATCMPAFQWTWSGFGFCREPLLRDADLMQLTGQMGASRRVETVSGTSQAHVYLMRTRDLAGEITFVAVSRTWLVLIGAGVTLAIGMLLIYVPLLRNTAVGFAGAVVLVALGLLYPEPVLIFAQLASLGLLLFLLSVLLRVVMTLRRRRRLAPIVISRSSSRYPLTEAYQQVVEPPPLSAVGSTVASPQKLGGPIASSEP